MKEAMGNSMIFMIIITFVSVLILILATSTTYSKASKVKNRIVEMIEANQGYGENGNDAALVRGSEFEEEINDELEKYGYKIRINKLNGCKARTGVVDGVPYSTIYAINDSSKYEYCVYKNVTSKGVYYGVETYMYFNIPIVDNIKIGIYGETKTLNDLSKF